jgi:RNA cap guanine-N2 methyltransferase
MSTSVNESATNARSPVYDRALLLHGSKRNKVLTLVEVERYGRDSFGDSDYLSIYRMPPRVWYRRGIRLLGRTAVECTRDELADRIGLDVASVAALMPSMRRWVVIDPFAGSCNTLFWILRDLPNSAGIAFEADLQVFKLTRRNLAALDQRIELVHGDYLRLLGQHRVAEDRGIVAFVAPPWGTALDEVEGLDLRRTTPPIGEVIERIAQQFPRHDIIFAAQLYEKVNASSLAQLQTEFDWSELRIYDINEKGRNHGIFLGTKGWAPR